MQIKREATWDPPRVGNRSNRIVYRVVGNPPTLESSRADRLRWIRRLYTRWLLPMFAIVWLLAAASGVPAGILILLGVLTASCAWRLVSISLQIRREDKLGG